VFESRSWRGVLDRTLCNKICQSLAPGRWFSLGIPDSSNNKAERHDITDIFLKAALNTITQPKVSHYSNYEYRNGIKELSFYINLCLSVMLDCFYSSFTFITFLTYNILILGFVSSVIVKVNIESIVTYMCYIIYKHCIICDIKHQYSCQRCTILYVFLNCFTVMNITSRLTLNWNI